MKNRIFRLFWIFFEKFGLVFLSFFSFYAFAYFLTPEQVGVGVLVLGVIELTGLLFSSTLDSAFVRLKTITSENDGTFFWVNLFTGIVTAVILCVGTLIFEDDLDIIFLMMFGALNIPLLLLSRVYVAHLQRDGNFKSLAIRTLFGKIFGMLAGIVLAYLGYGPWAIVAQSVVMQFFSTFVLMVMNRRALPFHIDWSFYWELVTAGFPVAIKALNWKLLSKGLVLIIGAVAGSAAVGYFNLASRLVELPRSAISNGLLSYALPVMSRRQDNIKKLRDFYTDATSFSSLLMTPMFFGLSVLADPLVNVFFGEKWVPAIPTLQLLSVIAGIGTIHLFSPSLFIALNQAKRNVKAQITGNVIALILVYFIAEEYGALGGAIALGIKTLLIFPITTWVILQLLDMRLKTYLASISKTLSSGLGMYASLYLIQREWVHNDNIITLAILIFTGVIVYFSLYTLLDKRWLIRFKHFIERS